MKNIKDTIMIIDDEPMFLDWLVDYLTYLKYKSILVKNVSEAMENMINTRYRAIIIDLNLPIDEEHESLLNGKDPLYRKYHGLIIAERARNMGYRNRQVIVYSVHSDAGVREIANQLDFSYITKGRPHIFKAEIEEVLGFDPTVDQTPNNKK